MDRIRRPDLEAPRAGWLPFHRELGEFEVPNSASNVLPRVYYDPTSHPPMRAGPRAQFRCHADVWLLREALIRGHQSVLAEAEAEALDGWSRARGKGYIARFEALRR